MRSIIAACGCGLLFLLGTSLAGAAEPTAEWKLLDRMAGTWEWEVVAKPAEWTPAETKGTGTLVRTWVLKNTFLQEQGGSPEEPAIFMWHYDTDKKKFVLHQFTSLGKATQILGAWDAEKKMMTWNSDFGGGITAVGTADYSEKDSDNWQMVAKDASGKIYLDLHGKNKRKK